MKTLSHTSRRLRKAITPLALAAACVTAPVWSATDSMDAMWNYTRPAMGGPSGSIGGYLGGLQVRVPVRNFNLLSVDAPRFHAGCSGIDLYLGSFSMMSAEALSGVLRSIIASAGGYAVQMAIEAICPPCANYVSKFQTLMSQLNSGAMNTCQIGKTIALGAAANLFNDEEKAQKYEQEAAVTTNSVNDIYEAMTRVFTSPNANRGAAQDKSTAYGNSLVNSLATSGAAEGLDEALLGGQQNAIELMMNLFGFAVTPTTDQGGSGSNPREDKVYQPLLSYNDLKNGRSGDEGAQKINACASSLLSFGSNDCQHIEPKSFTFNGIKRGIVRQLAGEQAGDGLTINEIKGGSILAITGTQNKTGDVALNDVQQRLMAVVPSALRPLWNIAGSDTVTGMDAANKIADVLADVVASQQLEALVRTMRMAHRPGSVGDKKMAPLSEAQERAILERQNEMRAAGATGAALDALIANLVSAFILAQRNDQPT